MLSVMLMIFSSCSSFKQHVAGLKSESSQERVEHIHWLYENAPGPTTQKLLIESLRNDKSEVVRSLAVRLLALQHNPDVIPILILSLRDSHPLVRMEVVQSLGTLQAYSELPTLVKQLKTESDVLTRLKILKTINYLNATEAIPDLVDCLDDEETAVRFQSLMLLEKFTQTKAGLDKESWIHWKPESQ